MENAKHMEFEVQLTEKDCRDLLLLHQRNMMRISFVAYFLLFFLAMFVLNDYRWEALYVAIGLVGGLVVGFVITGVTYGIIVIQAKRHFQSDNLLKLKQTYHLSDEGIRAESTAGTTEIKWGDVLKVTSSKTIVALYVGKGRALILTKRAIQGEQGDGWPLFESIVKTHLRADQVKLA